MEDIGIQTNISASISIMEMVCASCDTSLEVGNMSWWVNECMTWNLRKGTETYKTSCREIWHNPG